MTSPDPHRLGRFVDAQEPVYEAVLTELRQGRKRTHWMWFIFPQVDGLGSSPTARHFAIRSRDEAEAYLQHPVLGPRLLECLDALMTHPHRDIRDIMGSPDDLKLLSSLTLFAGLSAPGSLFHAALFHFFTDERDQWTERLLK